MKERIRSYTDIVSFDDDGITFSSGDRIIFSECGEDNCVAERDIYAKPPYIEFYTTDRHTKVVFDRTGLLSQTVNEREFIKLQSIINEAGYKSYDLS
ncbi:hypothetical protein RASY3_16970 [Ruminococcus albus SY3]|uniref:Uncharacterized protein n=1 Tax=Ruminococcus albus SY3 TaxID=1341156 RepID=A0A011UBN9_RUMAL|nr:hypothetical protein [Ruminococcus albus]EXM37994.1 hypothetical protein RASY3_16970 [Ruminococcus albus SY3]